jgi:hypothetical protein
MHSTQHNICARFCSYFLKTWKWHSIMGCRYKWEFPPGWCSRFPLLVVRIPPKFPFASLQLGLNWLPIYNSYCWPFPSILYVWDILSFQYKLGLWENAPATSYIFSIHQKTSLHQSQKSKILHKYCSEPAQTGKFTAHVLIQLRIALHRDLYSGSDNDL